MKPLLTSSNLQIWWSHKRKSHSYGVNHTSPSANRGTLKNIGKTNQNLTTTKHNKAQTVCTHYNDIIMGVMASQITNLSSVYSTLYSRRRSKKASKLRVTGLCEGNSPLTGEFPAQRPVTGKIFPFDDIIMNSSDILLLQDSLHQHGSKSHSSQIVIPNYKTLNFVHKISLHVICITEND